MSATAHNTAPALTALAAADPQAADGIGIHPVCSPQAELFRPHAAIYGNSSSLLLEGIRSGEINGRVGLLPSLRPKAMDKYTLTRESKTRRAPREDLTSFTAEERVKRRNERARYYSNVARVRQEQMLQDIGTEVSAMRIYQTIIEKAPHMVMVLSTDIRCTLLYVNEAFAHMLYRPSASLLGSSFWTLVHPDDQTRVQTMASFVILSTTSLQHPIACRIKVGFSNVFTTMDLRVSYGTQGLVCTMWESGTAREKV